MPFASDIKDALRPVVYGARHRWNTALYGSCTVLLYHRVIDLPTDPQLLAVHPERFDQQLHVLKRTCEVLTIAQFDDHLLNHKKFPKNAVLLTFDDGYADNHLEARPLLEKHGLQALFYIATDYIGAGREYWWDELERLFLLNASLPSEFNFDEGGLCLKWLLNRPDKGSVEEAYRSAMGQLRRIPTAKREMIMDRLRQRLHPTPPRSSHLSMDQDQLLSFATSPSVIIGAHTMGHPSLGYLETQEQEREIVGSKAALEKMLGKEVSYFSYPFGTGADFNVTSEQIVRKAGFKHTAANYPGAVHSRSLQHRFPRFLVRDWDGPEFAKRLRIFFHG